MPTGGERQTGGRSGIGAWSGASGCFGWKADVLPNVFESSDPRSRFAQEPTPPYEKATGRVVQRLASRTFEHDAVNCPSVGKVKPHHNLAVLACRVVVVSYKLVRVCYGPRSNDRETKHLRVLVAKLNRGGAASYVAGRCGRGDCHGEQYADHGRYLLQNLSMRECPQLGRNHRRAHARALKASGGAAGTPPMPRPRAASFRSAGSRESRWAGSGSRTACPARAGGGRDRPSDRSGRCDRHRRR